MTKVYIKQIAKASDADGNVDTEYLDSQGRVWFDAGATFIDEENSTINGDGSRKNVYKWVSNWKQVDLRKQGVVLPNIRRTFVETIDVNAMNRLIAEKFGKL